MIDMKTSSRRVKETSDEDSTRIRQTHGMVIFLVIITSIAVAIILYQLAKFNLIASMP